MIECPPRPSSTTLTTAKDPDEFDDAGLTREYDYEGEDEDEDREDEKY